MSILDKLGSLLWPKEKVVTYPDSPLIEGKAITITTLICPDCNIPMLFRGTSTEATYYRCIECRAVYRRAEDSTCIQLLVPPMPRDVRW